MRVIGFNFTKVSAERQPSFKSKSAINTDIEFKDIDKEELDLLKDKEPVKVSFLFKITYTNQENKKDKNPDAELSFEGSIILSTDKEESKEILKSWKKKEMPNSFKIPMFNLILKKCTPKALQLQDELNLPSHIPMPQLVPQNKA